MSKHIALNELTVPSPTAEALDRRLQVLESEGVSSMRANERDLIDAVDRVLSVPLPASGTQSTTVRGVASYAADMRSLVPLARQAVEVLRQGECYRGHRRCLLDELNRAVDAIMDRVRG